MPELTIDLTKKYVDDDGQHCPFCGGETLSVDLREVSVNTVEVECDDCGEVWQEVNALVGIIHETATIVFEKDGVRHERH